LSFFLFAEHAAVFAHLQFRIAIEVSKRGEVADDMPSVVRLRDGADDVDDGGNYRPITPSDAIQPLKKKPPVARNDPNDHKGHQKREIVPIVGCSTQDDAGYRLIHSGPYKIRSIVARVSLLS